MSQQPGLYRLLLVEKVLYDSRAYTLVAEHAYRKCYLRTDSSNLKHSGLRGTPLPDSLDRAFAIGMLPFLLPSCQAVK